MQQCYTVSQNLISKYDKQFNHSLGIKQEQTVAYVY